MSPRIRWAESTFAQVVPTPPTEVRTFYRDLSRRGEAPPLLFGVECLPDTEEHRVRSSNYRVTDRTLLGPWSYRGLGVRDHLTVLDNLRRQFEPAGAGSR